MWLLLSIVSKLNVKIGKKCCNNFKDRKTHSAVQSVSHQLLFLFHNTSNVRLKLKCRSCFSEFSYNKRALRLSDVEECLKFILRRGNLIAKLRTEVGNQRGC